MIAYLKRVIPYRMRHPIGMFLLNARPLVTRWCKLLGFSKFLWRRALPSERKFWDGYLREKNYDWNDDTYMFRVDPDSTLQHFIVEQLASTVGETVRILDVGAGPLTCLGKNWEGYRLDICATDPLADDYDKLLRKHNIKPLVRTIAADAERLEEVFSNSEFDLSFARNSLDHSYDLPLAICQMIYVTKPDGFVILQHHANEAEKMGYLGLHQWNFALKGGELMMDNQVRRISLRAICGEQAEIIRSSEEDRLITVVIKKRALRR